MSRLSSNTELETRTRSETAQQQTSIVRGRWRICSPTYKWEPRICWLEPPHVPNQIHVSKLDECKCSRISTLLLTRQFSPVRHRLPLVRECVSETVNDNLECKELKRRYECMAGSGLPTGGESESHWGSCLQALGQGGARCDLQDFILYC